MLFLSSLSLAKSLSPRGFELQLLRTIFLEQVRKGGLPPLVGTRTCWSFVAWPTSGGKPPFLTCSFSEPQPKVTAAAISTAWRSPQILLCIHDLFLLRLPCLGRFPG